MSYRMMASALAVTFALTTQALTAEVTRKVEVDGDKAKVWATIGGWCAIGNWHPVIAKCEETQSGGKKHRTLTTKDGGVIKETMQQSSETSYTYSIDESPLPVSNYTATLSVVPDADDADEVNIVWSAKFDPKGDEAAAKTVIDGIFAAGLAEIKKKLK